MKKKKIRNIIIVFFSFVLILTFLSNTIMNYSLSQVMVSSVQPGIIKKQVFGSGTVESGVLTSLQFRLTRVIEDMKVIAGDQVKKGDVLCTLKTCQSDEVEQMEEELLAQKFELYRPIIFRF